ncbi:putative SIR2 family histone deacetylase [Talaromyces proteolyticus]|uniref:SIR2 family histone deacetylase n=1 Tax=Talaromyces proteolyticus TaxID=1131652 RepID=A0AAD4PYJ1_9EURO|nr:putative SIR2 family histone deacetylase [Talaromyces proteolyticus]KAH8701570.1 putative SIR2 family histone deacetylase [Talaromyces proteolyticus]
MNTTSQSKSTSSIQEQTPQINSIDAIATRIKNGDIKRIVVIAGAGISTSAGYPDFRSPKTGIYDKTAALKTLPYREAIFDVRYFKHTPEPFFAVLRGLMQMNFKPTVTHAFLSLLHRMEVLEMVFTQNIDGLERAAGVPDEKVVAAHGQFGSQRCMICKISWPSDRFERVVKSGQVPRCDDAFCNGLIKPDTVMFGEPLSQNFATSTKLLDSADLILVMGTSLKVHPVAALPSQVPKGVPRVLLNREKAGDLGSRREDILLLGDCDEGVRSIADALGLRDELENLWRAVGPQPGEFVKLEDALVRELDSYVNDQLREKELISQGHKGLLEKHIQEKLSRMRNPDSGAVLYP